MHKHEQPKGKQPANVKSISFPLRSRSVNRAWYQVLLRAGMRAGLGGRAEGEPELKSDVVNVEGIGPGFFRAGLLAVIFNIRIPVVSDCPFP